MGSGHCLEDLFLDLPRRARVWFDTDLAVGQKPKDILQQVSVYTRDVEGAHYGPWRIVLKVPPTYREERVKRRDHLFMYPQV